MHIFRQIGLVILVLAWVSLAVLVFVNAGITLYNILIVAISGAIVFIPIWKKYFKRQS